MSTVEQRVKLLARLAGQLVPRHELIPVSPGVTRLVTYYRIPHIPFLTNNLVPVWVEHRPQLEGLEREDPEKVLNIAARRLGLENGEEASGYVQSPLF